MGVSRKLENTGFICENCGREVLPLQNGSYRNHCPFCLYSKHVDENPGDRSSECGKLMKTIGVRNNSKKGLQIIHKCLQCGTEKINKVAEDNVQPDDFDKITELF